MLMEQPHVAVYFQWRALKARILLLSRGLPPLPVRLQRYSQHGLNIKFLSVVTASQA
ncbi:UNVERIFIED_CONTAM: hypothetical protein GTU68_058478 [Idotea baltica]|nr:hypothetical protein [Idotea baltica]